MIIWEKSKPIWTKIYGHGKFALDILQLHFCLQIYRRSYQIFENEIAITMEQTWILMFCKEHSFKLINIFYLCSFLCFSVLSHLFHFFHWYWKIQVHTVSKTKLVVENSILSESGLWKIPDTLHDGNEANNVHHSSMISLLEKV